MIVVVNHKTNAQKNADVKNLLYNHFPHIQQYNLIVTDVMKQPIPGKEDMTVGGYAVTIDIDDNKLIVESIDTRSTYKETYNDPFNNNKKDEIAKPGVTPG